MVRSQFRLRLGRCVYNRYNTYIVTKILWVISTLLVNTKRPFQFGRFTPTYSFNSPVPRFRATSYHGYRTLALAVLAAISESRRPEDGYCVSKSVVETSAL